MQKFHVPEDCNACGRCIIMTDLLLEEPDGKAIPSDTEYISEEFLSEAKNIIDICPVNALSIVESTSTKSKGKNGLNELKKLLEAKLNAVELNKVDVKTIKFDAHNYHISEPYPSGEYEYNYSSYSQAENAGIQEFNKIAYSRAKEFVLSVFVQYKNDKLKPFYTFEAVEDSYYYDTIKSYESILKEISTEAKYMSDGKISLPSDFNTFYVSLPDTGLQSFESRSTSSGVMTEFKSEKYHALNEYDMYLDIDDTETYVGDSLFGNPKYKDKYCYTNVSKAVREFIKDLKQTMNYVDIDEKALYHVNSTIQMYIDDSHKLINKKIDEFSQAISKIS